MPVTVLDPHPALILIDLQKGIVSLPTVHPAGDIVKHARALADAFRGRGLPVILVNVGGGAPGRTQQSGSRAARPADWADLISEINRQPQDHTVTKQTWGAFTGTGLDRHFKDLGVTQLFIAGIATSIGVESTARQAHELAFNVVVATDAVTDMNPDAHANSITRIFPRLGETATTREILDLLGRAAG
jgi:nicotinamidase-related amidase